MSDFKREERYIVIKRKNLDALEEDAVRRLLADNGIPTVECVVVEHDWPNYEGTWKAIEQVVDGTYVSGEITSLRQQLEQAQARVAELEKCVDDGSDAGLLRKQAEAVEAANDSLRSEINDIPRTIISQRERYLLDGARRRIKQYAQRLRQRADELEQPK